MRPIILRPSSGITVTVVIWVIAAIILISLLFVGDGPGSELWFIAPAVGTVGWLVWVALWWPSVRIAGEGIEVRNPLRTVRLPWDEVRDVDSRGSLVITTSAGPVSAWAAPPNTVLGDRRAEFVARARTWRSGREYQAPDVSRRPSEPDAAEIIRRVQSGRTKVPQTGEPYAGMTTSWNFIVIAISVLLIGWSITSLI